MDSANKVRFWHWEISQTVLHVVYLQFLADIFPVSSHSAVRDVQLPYYVLGRYTIFDKGRNPQFGERKDRCHTGVHGEPGSQVFNLHSQRIELAFIPGKGFVIPQLLDHGYYEISQFHRDSLLNIFSLALDILSKNRQGPVGVAKLRIQVFKPLLLTEQFRAALFQIVYELSESPLVFEGLQGPQDRMVQQLIAKGLLQQVEGPELECPDSRILIGESRYDNDFEIVRRFGADLRDQVQSADIGYENVEQDNIALILTHMRQGGSGWVKPLTQRPQD
jgi:hypothetical protein